MRGMMNLRQHEHRLTAPACAAALMLTLLVSPASLRAQQARPDDLPAAPDEDPLVEAVLETNPTTPEQLVRAVNVLVDLKRPAAARPLLQQLLDLQLADDQLAALADRLGAGQLLKLSTDPQLQPEGRQFAQSALDASDRRAADEDRLARLIEQLQDPTPGARRQAILQLRLAGSPAVSALLAVLADENRANEHDDVRTALVGFGRGAVPQLLGALDAPNGQLVAGVIEVLGRLQAIEPTIATSLACPTPHLLAAAVSPQSPESVALAAQRAVVDLTGRLPTAGEVADLLERQARHFQALSRGGADDLPSREVEFWRWDPEAGTSVGELISTRHAAVEMAAHHARGAYELSPNNRLRRRLYLVTLCEAELQRHGWEGPLPDEPGSAMAELTAMGPDALVDLLNEALANNFDGAGTLACRALGDVAAPEVVYRDGARPSALVRALRHPNAYVQFAAAEALVKIAPPRPFPGSSWLVDTLARIAGTTGYSRAFVVHARADEASRLVALLSSIGYEAEPSTDGRQFFSTMASSPDCDLIVISNALPRKPTASELINELRRDPRTARVPIALVATEDDWHQAERLARKFPRTEAIIRPHDVEGMQVQIERLVAGTDGVSNEERIRQAGHALQWLAQLAAQRRSYHDVRALEPQLAVALNHPQLSIAAAGVLAELGTPAAQLDLLNVVHRYSLPLEQRRAAALAFCRSVQRHRTQLTSRQILDQYDRYEQSEHLDPETRELLGMILDCLEARVATGEGLPDVPNTPVPEAP